MLSSTPIVAGSGTEPLFHLRVRLGLAIAALLMMASLGLFRALSEPSTGWRFDVDANQTVQAIELSGHQRLRGVQSVKGVDCSGMPMQVALTADLMRETGGIAEFYSEHQRFYAAHERLWTLLSCSYAASAPLSVAHSDGSALLVLDSKPLRELGLRFWFPWVFGLLAFSVGLAVWVYRPVDRTASWYLLASASYAFWVMVVAAMGSRHLTQPSLGLQALHLACHAAGHLYLIGLCMLLWRFPSSLDRPRIRESALMWGMLAWAAAAMLIDAKQWVPTINWGFRLPNLALAVLLALLFSAQWRASRDDPLKRAPLKWLGFLLILTLSLGFFTTLFAIANQWTAGRMAYGFAPMSLVFLGFVPLVTRLKLFKLEIWWTRAWLWFLGGVLVVLLDVLLVRWFALDGGVALGIALALAGWLYFPMRQWLWQSLSRSALPQTSDILPDIVALSAPSAGRSLGVAWQRLWENHWHPLSIRELAIAEQLEIRAQGQSLRIPGLGPLPALELGMPLRGARLYNTLDLKRAQEVCTLLRIGLDAANAAQQGALEERQRIASDLHDDLGAKLLTIAQTAEQPQHGSRVAELARQALEDMRLALRGLSAGPMRVGELQADWRAELMARLDVANIEASWQANEAPQALLLTATAQVQLTRVLRETVSNVIRHSQAKHCEVGVHWGSHSLNIKVQDDGIGLPSVQAVPGQRQGLGLNNIERRVHKLGGLIRWESNPGAGLCMEADIPLHALKSDASS